MQPVSNNTIQDSTSKCSKIHRTQPTIARKVVAFQELINLERHKKSAREVAELLEIPNSTMQSWRKQTNCQQAPIELIEFFSTPVGADFLQRNTMAVMKLMKCGPGGIRGMQEYLRNSGLDNFVASSEGALQAFWSRCEIHLIKFSKNEEQKLASKMRRRKITVGLDELFRGRRPCLVAIEVVSNYILLEKFTEDRTADTWKRELEPRLNDVNVELGQAVSDLCGAIRAVTKDLGAEHISELFHAQYEISKATSAPLASQERHAEIELKKAEETIKKIQETPIRLGKEDSKNKRIEKQWLIERAVNVRNNLKVKFEQKSKRRKEVKTAVREMGIIHHPINLKSGALQTADGMAAIPAEQFFRVSKIFLS